MSLGWSSVNEATMSFVWYRRCRSDWGPLLQGDLDPGPDHLRGRHLEQFRVIRADVVADQRHDPVLVIVGMT